MITAPEILNINEEYKTIYDTIWIYVADTRNGGGWDQELDVIDHDIKKTIDNYRKSLGYGYRIEYNGPGKTHSMKDEKKGYTQLTLFDNLQEKIVKKGNQWQVQSEKGRNMGTYDTKAEAEKRLQQVHYFKYKNEDLTENIEKSFLAYCKDRNINYILNANGIELPTWRDYIKALDLLGDMNIPYKAFDGGSKQLIIDKKYLTEGYEAPYNAEEIKKNYGEEIYNKLVNDPAHKWRMETGIELIHKEPTLKELNRIWDNWNKMTDTQKKESNKKSLELFGITNEENYNKLLSSYSEAEILHEDTRTALINKSRNVDTYKDQSHGKNRWERKKYSKVANAVKEYNQIDMNDFFKRDILTVKVPVQGETDNYIVSIQMEGVLAEIAKNVKSNKNKFEFRTVIQALTKIFNTGNLKVNCTCKDFLYNYKHNLIINKNEIDGSDKDPGPGKTGRTALMKSQGCKHILNVLNNLDWLMKIASVISNYTHYAEEHMQKPFLKLIFPKIYGIPADEMIEQDLIDEDKFLDSSKGLIDAINAYGAKRGQYKPGTNKNPVTGTGGRTKKEEENKEENN